MTLSDRQLTLVMVGLTVLVTVISLGALVATVTQAALMSATMRNSVTPIIEFETGNIDPRALDKSTIYFSVANKGIGPARILSAKLVSDDQDFYRFTDYINHCCRSSENANTDDTRIDDENSPVEISIITSVVSPRILSAGESVHFFIFPKPETPGREDEIWRQLDQVRLGVSIVACYCSMFDQCWQTDSQTSVSTRVRSCEPAEPNFPVYSVD